MVIFALQNSLKLIFLWFFEKFSNVRGIRPPDPPFHARLSFAPVFPIILPPPRDKSLPYATDP